MGVALATTQQLFVEEYDNMMDGFRFASDSYGENIKVWIDGSKSIEGFFKLGVLLTQLIGRVTPIANELFSSIGGDLLGLAHVVKGTRDLFAVPRFIYDWKDLCKYMERVYIQSEDDNEIRKRKLYFDRIIAITFFAALADTFKSIEILAKRKVINLGLCTTPILEPVKWLVDSGVPLGFVGTGVYDLRGISKIFNFFKFLTIISARTYDSWTKTVEDMARELAKKDNHHDFDILEPEEQQVYRDLVEASNVEDIAKALARKDNYYDFDALDPEEQQLYMDQAEKFIKPGNRNRLQWMLYKNRFRIIHAGIGMCLFLRGSIMPIVAVAPLSTYVALNALRALKRKHIKDKMKLLRAERDAILQEQEGWEFVPVLNTRFVAIERQIQTLKEKRQKMSRSWIPGYI